MHKPGWPDICTNQGSLSILILSQSVSLLSFKIGCNLFLNLCFGILCWKYILHSSINLRLGKYLWVVPGPILYFLAIMHSSYLKILSKVLLALLFYVFIIIRYFFKKVFNIIENLFQDVVSITLAKFSIITHQSHISQVPSLTESLTYITSRASCDAKNHLVFGFIFIKLFAVFGILLQFIQLSWSSA